MSRSACGSGTSKNNPTWRMPAITVSRPTCSYASNSGESIRRMPLTCCHIDRTFLSRPMPVSQSITPYNPPCYGCGDGAACVPTWRREPSYVEMGIGIQANMAHSVGKYDPSGNSRWVFGVVSKVPTRRRFDLIRGRGAARSNSATLQKRYGNSSGAPAPESSSRRFVLLWHGGSLAACCPGRFCSDILPRRNIPSSASKLARSHPRRGLHSLDRLVCLPNRSRQRKARGPASAHWSDRLRPCHGDDRSRRVDCERPVGPTLRSTRKRDAGGRSRFLCGPKDVHR